MRLLKLKKLKRVHGVHYAPDGKRLLAVGGEEARMVDSAVWLDLATGETVGRIDQFAECYAVDPALSRYVLGGATRGRGWGGIAAVQWTALAVGGEWRPFQPTGKNASPKFRDVSGLAFDSAGVKLAVSHSRPAPWRGRNERINQISVVQLDSKGARIDFPLSEPAGVIAFNADARRIAYTGGLDGETDVRACRLPDFQKGFVFRPTGTVTRSVLFLPDDRLVVANGRNVYVLPPDKPEPLLTLAGHPKQVNAVALTPDGRRILTASHDGSIRTWNAHTGEPGPQFDWGIGPVTALAFAPDGLTCVAAGFNGKLVLWDVDA